MSKLSFEIDKYDYVSAAELYVHDFRENKENASERITVLYETNDFKEWITDRFNYVQKQNNPNSKNYSADEVEVELRKEVSDRNGIMQTLKPCTKIVIQFGDDKDVKKFRDSLSFLEKELGKENIAYAVLHKDEKSYHLHVLCCGITNSEKHRESSYVLDDDGNRVMQPNGRPKRVFKWVKGNEEIKLGHNAKFTAGYYTKIKKKCTKYLENKGYVIDPDEPTPDRKHLTTKEYKLLEKKALNSLDSLDKIKANSEILPAKEGGFFTEKKPARMVLTKKDAEKLFATSEKGILDSLELKRRKSIAKKFEKVKQENEELREENKSLLAKKEREISVDLDTSKKDELMRVKRQIEQELQKREALGLTDKQKLTTKINTNSKNNFRDRQI